MYQAKYEKDIRCPIKYWQEIFEGKWKACIVCILSEYDSLRYGRIREKIGGITDTVLSNDLKELTEANIIERKQYDEIPIRVEYSLTEKGQSVLPVLCTVCAWAKKYYLEVENAEIRCCKYEKCMKMKG